MDKGDTRAEGFRVYVWSSDRYEAEDSTSQNKTLENTIAATGHEPDVSRSVPQRDIGLDKGVS